MVDELLLTIVEFPNATVLFSYKCQSHVKRKDNEDQEARLLFVLPLILTSIKHCKHQMILIYRLPGINTKIF